MIRFRVVALRAFGSSPGDFSVLGSSSSSVLGTSAGSASSGESACSGVVASPSEVSDAGVGVGVCASGESSSFAVGSGVLSVMI
ncbi:hypothetical protein AB1285_18685, partial [Microbacterium sp. NRRL B-14842]|uniref:hypothetical protein n=1 Tax=Microbacterium sp. NRRL B-14842 TaxID=3162881 RepID=UPI003D2B2FA0